MTVKYGNVTWYCNCTGGCSCCWQLNCSCQALCCPQGGGACGSCNDGSLHCAYPRLGTGCIYDVCTTMCQHNCGDQVNITNLCPGGGQQNITIEDCYPLQSADCNRASACTSQVPPLADLTRGAFMAIGGDLAQGRIPAKMVC